MRKIYFWLDDTVKDIYVHNSRRTVGFPIEWFLGIPVVVIWLVLKIFYFKKPSNS